MLRRFAALVTAVMLAFAVLVVRPPSTFAFDPGYPCSLLENAHYGSIDYQGTGYPLNEVAGYVVSFPNIGDTNNWRSCTYDGLPGYNSFCISLESAPNAYIVQICATRGIESGNILTSPTWLYTATDNTGGSLTVVGFAPAPVAGHNYYIQVMNTSAGGYHYWRYCINDLNAGTGGQCTLAIDTIGFSSGWSAWVAGETWNSTDVMGAWSQFGTANYNYEIYAFHDRRTNQTSGQYLGTSYRCNMMSGGQSQYHCASAMVGTWPAFAPYTTP